MIAENLVSDNIPSVEPEETGIKVLNLMELFRVSHLPVVSGQEYFGMISDQNIYDAENFEKKIEDYSLNLLQPHVHKNQHLLEVISVAKRYNISAVPVLDMDHSYMGTVSYSEMTTGLLNLLAVDEPGGVIILELCEVDFSLSEIANIIEGNDAKVLNFFAYKPSKSSKELDIIIKINKIDLSGIIQTFTRYDYTVKATFMDESSIKNLYDDRFDQFMRYVNT
jgi:predicted transcriptional regulator